MAFVSTRPYVSLLREKKQKGIRLERKRYLAKVRRKKNPQRQTHKEPQL